MSYRCPNCGSSARSRFTEYDEHCIRAMFHQCNNLYCGISFRTRTEVDKIISPPVDGAGMLKAGLDQG